MLARNVKWIFLSTWGICGIIGAIGLQHLEEFQEKRVEPWPGQDVKLPEAEKIREAVSVDGQES